MVSLQQEAQPQSTEEESSEKPEDNAQAEPIRQDSETACYPPARPCGKKLNHTGKNTALHQVTVSFCFPTDQGQDAEDEEETWKEGTCQTQGVNL